jgi:hypothetical protein
MRRAIQRHGQIAVAPRTVSVKYSSLIDRSGTVNSSMRQTAVGAFSLSILMTARRAG